ncbi:hypothetical protein ANSO36C_25910 [Nostoc cf. commune SO-36]|uniref:Uncharacterized protein n=1 Tax=Nostoc cf. commune SO-36 TaxID=449208 RepID=A0ABM7Z1D5_NOSCO|nr:hypothetical protein [Nostoc commune]BDI16789.1 hypothetical protein ANSO36C_25910 [Nostoc cf. commune SO-36]
MNSVKVGDFFASPNTGVIGELITILNNEYELQINSQVFRLNQSQFNKLIQVPDIILQLLNRPQEISLATNKQLVNSFLDAAKVLYFDGKMEYTVLEEWREKLGFTFSNEISSVTNYGDSLEYGGLYLGGDWRDDYDPRY